MKNIFLIMFLAVGLTVGFQTGIPVIDQAILKTADAVEMIPASQAGSARRSFRRVERHEAGYGIKNLPRDCTTVLKKSGTYYLCGNTYYVGTYVGDSVVYVVVPEP